MPESTTQAASALATPSEAAPKEAAAQAHPSASPNTEPTAKEKRVYELVVNGQKEKLEVTDDEIKAALQKEKASSRILSGHKILEEKLKKFESMSPEEYLKQRGIDIEKFAEERLMAVIEQHKKTPEQRRAEEKEREADELKKKLSEIEKKSQEEAIERQAEEMREALVGGFNDALKAEGLPATPKTLRMMAQRLEQVDSRGLSDQVTFADLAKVVKKDLQADLTGFIGEVDGEALLKTLPESVIEAIRKADISRLSTPKSDKVETSGQPNKSNSNEKKKFITPDEWRKMVNE